MQGKWFVTLKGAKFDLYELVKFNSPPKIEIKKIMKNIISVQRSLTCAKGQEKLKKLVKK